MSFCNCYTCGHIGRLARQRTASPLSESLPMKEEDRSDFGSDDNIASQTFVQNLGPLLLQDGDRMRRHREALSSRQILLIAVKVIAWEMKDFKVLMNPLSQRIDNLTVKNRAVRKQTPLSATQPLPPPLSKQPLGPKRKWTALQTPPRGEGEGEGPRGRGPANQPKDTSRTLTLMSSEHADVKPAPHGACRQHLLRPRGSHLAW